MDETLNQNVNVTPQPTLVVTAPSTVIYASFFRRGFANLIDGFLISIVAGVLARFFTDGSTPGQSLEGLVSFLVASIYSVLLITKKGQTLGKQALGIRVQNEATGQNLDIVSAILREVVGKFISVIVLFLGYLWMLWDPKNQTWHDKIAKSIVVKVK